MDTLDSTTLTALAVVLTVVAGALTVLAYRKRGAAAGLKGLAWTLLPFAALLTGTLELVVGFAEDVSRWAARLVFSPVVWSGVALAGLAVVLFVVGSMLGARGVGTAPRPRRARGEATAPGEPAAVEKAPRTKPASRGKGKDPHQGQDTAGGDEDMDEIEAILRKHGI